MLGMRPVPYRLPRPHQYARDVGTGETVSRERGDTPARGSNKAAYGDQGAQQLLREAPARAASLGSTGVDRGALEVAPASLERTPNPGRLFCRVRGKFRPGAAASGRAIGAASSGGRGGVFDPRRG